MTSGESFLGWAGTFLRSHSSQAGELSSSKTRYPLESSVWRTASGTLVSVKGPRVSILPFWAVQISESTRTQMMENVLLRTLVLSPFLYRAKVPTKALRFPWRSHEVPSPGALYE